MLEMRTCNAKNKMRSTFVWLLLSLVPPKHCTLLMPQYRTTGRMHFGFSSLLLHFFCFPGTENGVCVLRARHTSWTCIFISTTLALCWTVERAREQFIRKGYREMNCNYSAAHTRSFNICLENIRCCWLHIKTIVCPFIVRMQMFADAGTDV